MGQFAQYCSLETHWKQAKNTETPGHPPDPFQEFAFLANSPRLLPALGLKDIALSKEKLAVFWAQDQNHFFQSDFKNIN